MNNYDALLITYYVGGMNAGNIIVPKGASGKYYQSAYYSTSYHAILIFSVNWTNRQITASTDYIAGWTGWDARIVSVHGIKY